MPKTYTFPMGGIHVNKYKNTSDISIEFAGLPEFVTIPVKQHIGAPSKIIVNKGDKVKVGTLLADFDGVVSSDVHSSVSGEIVKMEALPNANGYEETMITIKVEGDEWEPSIDRSPDVVKEINFTPEEIVQKIRESGIVGMGGAGFPTPIKTSIPEGKKLAEKTFNPRLGIEGGISVIGTTGIVEPMSTKALLDTIKVELRQIKEMGQTVAVVSPGNYGLDFMKESFDYDLDKAVKCSNYIGDTIDMARELGFKKMLLCGHVGKLIKVSGGIMNTHSKEGDCRMELMATAAIRSGASTETLNDILNCVSTEEAIEIYKTANIEKKCFDYIMDKIDFYLNKRGAGEIQIQCIVYSNKFGLLGQTEEAEKYLEEAKGV